MAKIVRKLLDKTSVDEKIAEKAKALADKTTIDDKLFSASARLRKEIRSNTAKAILAAFGFMIALVWRDVVQEGVNRLIEFFSMSGDGFTFQIITAVITTIICVIGIVYFSRWGEKG